MEENPIRVHMKVKLSDTDLIFLGGAAILGSMMSKARSKKEAMSFVGDALDFSARLLETHQGEWQRAALERRAAVEKRAKKR